MFEDINISIDDFYYDKDQDLSVIQGWAIDNKTKNPVDISLNVPAYVYKNKHVHIPHIFNVTRNVDYGFFIVLPGDVTKIKPTLTFKSGDTVRKVDGLWFNTNKIFSRLRSFYVGMLNDETFHRRLNRFRRNKEEFGSAHVVRSEPEDVLTGWVVNKEPKEWTEVNSLELETLPKFTFIIKYSPKEEISGDKLIRTYQTVLDQFTKDFEVIIATDSSLPENLKVNSNTKIVKEENIIDSLNRAIDEAEGDYITFVESNDILSNHFLSEVYNYIQENPDDDFIYSDSDKIDDDMNRYDLLFKPNYDEIMLRSTNYILNPIILKKELLKDLGGFKEGSTELKNYPFIIEATRKAKKVGHIPKILYHWNENNKMDRPERMADVEKGVKILNDQFDGHFVSSEFDYIYDYKTDKEYPKVSIIIPSADDKETDKTIEKIIDSTIYPNYEIVTNSATPFVKHWVKNYPDIKATGVELENELAQRADSDYLEFIQPGFEPAESSWVRELMDYALLDDVGIVGPKFYNKYYGIEEAGLGISDNKRYQKERGKYVRTNALDYSIRIPKEVFGISKQSLLIPKDLFFELGGFNPKLKDNEIDLDLAIWARESGKKAIIQNQVAAKANFNEQEDSFDNLTNLYKPDRLIDRFTNDNLKPGSSVFEFLNGK